ncbi:MAG TPA: tetraacyldisaccharide 4'-kinase [Gemmatimonadota bacterium]|nr:tetraacyldisaccharide 4'-kinase [Gemmatimonadota bacterium]
MIADNEDESRRRQRGGEVVERARLYGWARRTLYGGGGLPGRLTRGALTPLSWAWSTAARRRLAPDPAAGRARLLPAPAVSVGNVTLGGGGKTSLVEWIVREGAPPGATVAVLSRGYGRTSAEPMALRPRSAPTAVAELGDEPTLLARAGAWVGVAGDRLRAARAVAELGARPDLFVLDDALQHRSLPRALDLVVFAAEDLAAPARCVPSGPLRQSAAWFPPHAVWVVAGADPREGEWPAGSIARAYAPWWRELPGTPAVWRDAGTVPLGAWWSGGDVAFDPRGRPVVAFAGVARPESVADSSRRAGHEIVALVAFPDHHAYRASDVAGLLRDHPGAAFLTTEKDAVKLEPAWFGDAPAGVLVRRIEPSDPGLLEREIADAMGWRS